MKRLHFGALAFLMVFSFFSVLIFNLSEVFACSCGCKMGSACEASCQASQSAGSKPMCAPAPAAK